jgi:hypothetical protein
MRKLLGTQGHASRENHIRSGMRKLLRMGSGGVDI